MAANKKARKPRVSAKAKNVEVDNNLLTLTDLVADDSQYDELEKVEFPDGRYTFVYKKFRPSTIDDMLEQYSEFINEYIRTRGELSDKSTQDYLNIYILLFFSKLSPDRPTDFKVKIDLFKKLLDSKTAEKIFDAFDSDQLSYVFDRMAKKIDNYMDIVKKNKEIRNQVIDYVEKSDMANKDIILSTMFGEGEENGNVEDEESGETI